jgi:hypothetical protein
LYALIHSFDPVDEDELELPNTLVGHYTPHFFSDDTRSTLFLVHIKAIRSPTLGIVADVPFGATKLPRYERHRLFLIRRRAAWPRAWDSMINRCRSPNDTEDTVFENEYKKLVTMPDDTKVSTVKTADDFADIIAAEVAAKERKDAEKMKKKKRKTTAVKTNETAFDKTPVVRETLVADTTAAQAAPQRLLGHLKRKRLTLGKKQEIGSSLFVLSNSSYISIPTLNVQTRNSLLYPASSSLVSCTSHQHPSPLQQTDSHHWLRI